MSKLNHRVLLTAIGALALGMATTLPASAQKIYPTTQPSSFMMDMATIFGHPIQTGVASDRCMANGAEILGGFAAADMVTCHR